jgi:hypothetical protein
MVPQPASHALKMASASGSILRILAGLGNGDIVGIPSALFNFALLGDGARLSFGVLGADCGPLGVQDLDALFGLVGSVGLHADDEQED